MSGAAEGEPVNAGLVGQLIHDGFVVLTEEPVLKEVISHPVIATPQVSLFPRQPQGKYKEVFLKVNSEEVFAHIASKTSDEMDRRVRLGIIIGQLADRYYRLPVTVKEIQVVLGLQFIFRTRPLLRTIERQFSELPNQLQAFPMASKRYRAITTCLTAEFPELAQLLGTAWKEAILPGTNWCVDETMYGFHSQSDPTSPQRFIPRKPVKSGLLSYFGAFKTAEGPFLFDLEPDWQVADQLNARTALRRMAARFWKGVPNHVVVDAGFSGEIPQQQLTDLGVHFTSSINQAHKRWLVDVLREHCPVGSKVTVADAEGMVWSFRRSEENEGELFVASTAFQAARRKVRELLVTEDGVKALAKVGLRGLVVLADMVGLQAQGEEHALATAIAAAVNFRAPIVDGPLPVPGDAPIVAENSVAASQGEDLKGKKLPELRTIAKGLNIRTGGKKRSEVATAITERRTIKQGDVARVTRELDSSASAEQGELHKKYRESFNAIDLHDKQWYAIEGHHSVHSWRAKFVLSLLQSGVVNAWVVMKHREQIAIGDFAFQLGLQLCH